MVKRRTGSTRPVIVKFPSFKSKDEVLRNAHKLKNVVSPEVWISDDFSPNVQFARQRLWDFASQFRDQNIRYCISFPLTNYVSETKRMCTIMKARLSSNCLSHHVQVHVQPSDSLKTNYLHRYLILEMYRRYLFLYRTFAA